MPILIISQIGTVLSFIMLAVAPTAAWLYAARVLDGLTGGNIIVAQAYVSDITPKENRQKALVWSWLHLVLVLSLVRRGWCLVWLAWPTSPLCDAAVAAAVTVLLSWFTLTGECYG